MSTPSPAMQMLPSEKPRFEDLFTLDLSTTDAWYKLGLELGLSIGTLNGIKSKHTKVHLCKRAMFREWMRVCPVEKCTWSYLLQALKKVDPKAARAVSETITSIPKLSPPISDQPHTAQFPLESGVKSDLSKFDTVAKQLTSSQSLTLSLSSGGGASVDSIKLGRIESDYSPSRSPCEVASSSTHDSFEMRSLSAEEYQTAGEDDSLTIQHFTYQHDLESTEESMSFSAGRNPVRFFIALIPAISVLVPHTFRL